MFRLTSEIITSSLRLPQTFDRIYTTAQTVVTDIDGFLYRFIDKSSLEILQ